MKSGCDASCRRSSPVSPAPEPLPTAQLLSPCDAAASPAAALVAQPSGRAAAQRCHGGNFAPLPWTPPPLPPLPTPPPPPVAAAKALSSLSRRRCRQYASADGAAQNACGQVCSTLPGKHLHQPTRVEVFSPSPHTATFTPTPTCVHVLPAPHLSLSLSLSYPFLSQQR